MWTLSAIINLMAVFMNIFVFSQSQNPISLIFILLNGLAFGASLAKMQKS